MANVLRRKKKTLYKGIDSFMLLRGGRTFGLSISLGICFLVGCANNIEEIKKLNAMIGQPEIEVIRQFGVPARKYEVDGHKFLAYIETNTDYTTYPAGGWGWGGGPWGGYYGGGPWNYGGLNGFNGYYSTVSCQTTFELANNKVISWNQRGDGC